MLIYFQEDLTSDTFSASLPINANLPQQVFDGSDIPQSVCFMTISMRVEGNVNHTMAYVRALSVNRGTGDNVVTCGHKYPNSYVWLESVILSAMFTDPTSLVKEGETKPVGDQCSFATRRASPLLAWFGALWASSCIGTNPIGPLEMTVPFSQQSPHGSLAGRTHVCRDSQQSMATSRGAHHSGPKKHLQTMGVP